MIRPTERSMACHISVSINRHLKGIFTKFRFGISNINMHYFRYRNYTQDHLLCPYCRNVEESEIHFVLCCPLYESIRKQYIKEKYYRSPNIFKLRILFCSTHVKTIEDLCRFLYIAFKIRETA